MESFPLVSSLGRIPQGWQAERILQHGCMGAGVDVEAGGWRRVTANKIRDLVRVGVWTGQ